MSRADSPLLGRMVFIVGARRSGTNWLQRALTAHPEVAAVPGETYLFYGGLKPLTELVQHDVAGSAQTASIYVDRDVFLDGTRALCDEIFGGILARVRPSARLLIERTPWHVYSLDLISSIYPDAAVLHLVRDGRDVARSLVAQPWGPTSMAEAAAEWRDSVEAGRAAAAGIDRFREVRYEALLADPKAHLVELYEFLGLPHDDDLVEAALVEVDIPYNLVPGEEGVSAQKWRTKLSPADLRTFDEVAGGTLAALGYEATPTVPAPRPALVPTAVAKLKGARRRISAHGRAKRQNRALQLRVSAAQEVAQAFLKCVGDPTDERLAQLMTADARVRVVAADDTWEARGEEARRRLLDVLRSDSVRGRPQLRGDVHPGVPSWVAILDYEIGAATTRRILVVTISGELVAELVYYLAVDDNGSAV